MTIRRRRRGIEAGEFQDPLKNYDPPIYEDELERSLDQDSVKNLQIVPFECVPPTATVEQALQIMADKDIACLMVTDEDRLVGIISERDVLYKLIDNFEQFRRLPIRLVMTTDPVVVYVTDSPAKALNIMAVGGFRHVPVLDMDDKVVGIVGPRRVTTYLEKFIAAAAS